MRAAAHFVTWPEPDPAGGESGLHLLHATLAALPVAAAVLVEGRAGEPVALMGNDAFVRIAVMPAGSEPMLARGGPIARATAALLAPGSTQEPRQLRWRDGDAVAGRHFEVHVCRADALAGGPACLLTLVDRTAEVESARSLRAELSHDSLTGLPNRSAFAEAVEQALLAGGRYAVVLADLARFSRVNESMGVMAGDEVIITVARRLLSALRAGDCLARVGGNEFGMLIRLRDRPDEAMAAARRIRAVLAAPFRLSQFEIGLECAIGCALSDGDTEGGEELVRAAQLSLKRAKMTGGIEIHSPGEAMLARHRLDMETELRRAIDRGGLSLAYQPIMTLSTGRCAGFEALARWTHAERGAIDPSEFITIAEETGLIVPLGRWALETAIAQMAAWDARAPGGTPVSLSVNVSAIQLQRDDVPAVIAALLRRHGVSGRRLTVELTESAIVQDPERAGHALQALRALDVRVAMDDFGTGYSSLNYLRRLPIDILKIDRSFVSAMLSDRDKVAIVRAVLSLADALGKRTTAEGVETAELGHMLAALGCTNGQGYHYAAPLDPESAYAFLRAQAG